MKRKIYSCDTYALYEEEYNKNEQLNKEIKFLKIEVKNLSDKLEYLRKKF